MKTLALLRRIKATQGHAAMLAAFDAPSREFSDRTINSMNPFPKFGLRYIWPCRCATCKLGKLSRSRVGSL